MSKQLVDDLKAARVLIAGDGKHSGWCRHTEAEDKAGEPVAAGDPRAVRWCLFGALKEIARRAGDTHRYAAMGDAVKRNLPPQFPWLYMFNDSCPSADSVLAVFDRAIAAEERDAAAVL